MASEENQINQLQNQQEEARALAMSQMQNMINENQNRSHVLFEPIDLDSFETSVEIITQLMNSNPAVRNVIMAQNPPPPFMGVSVSGSGDTPVSSFEPISQYSSLGSCNVTHVDVPSSLNDNLENTNVYLSLSRTLRARLEILEEEELNQLVMNQKSFHTENEKLIDVENENENEMFFKQFDDMVTEYKKKLHTQVLKTVEYEKQYTDCKKEFDNIIKNLLDLELSTAKIQSVLKNKNEDSYKKSILDFQTSLSSYVSELQSSSELKEYQEKYIRELVKLRHFMSMSKKYTESQKLPYCLICVENIPNRVFECGHVCCDKCASKLSQCHTCRIPLHHITKLHLY